MSPTEKLDVRSRIVVAAMELFFAKGYNSTSVADILSRTQLNAGSLYHVFPGKQDVLIAVLEWYRDGIDENLLNLAWEGVDDPIDRVFALLDRYHWMIVETDCTFGCPIGSLALELHEADPAIRDLLAINFTNWSAAIERCLDAAGDRLPKGLDRHALAEFVLTTMEGGVMQARTYRDVGYFDRGIGVLRDHFEMLEARARRQAPGARREREAVGGLA